MSPYGPAAGPACTGSTGYSRHTVLAAAAGQWRHIYSALLPESLAGALARPGRHVADPVTGEPRRFAFIRGYEKAGTSVVEPCGYMNGFDTLMYVLGCSFPEAVNSVGRLLLPAGPGEEITSSRPGTRRIRGTVTRLENPGSPDGFLTVIACELSGRDETVRGRSVHRSFASKDVRTGERLALSCLAVESVRSPSGRTFTRTRWQLEKLPPREEEERLERRASMRREAQRRRIAALWEKGLPFDPEDARELPLVRYLASRRILDAGKDFLYREIRFAPCLPHFEGGRETRRPAMLAAVRDLSGGLAAVHRTWLAPDGRKAGVEAARQVTRLPDGATVSGCAVRIGGDFPVVGLAEGIETALSCALACGIPVWSAISAPGLMSARLPAGTRAAVIFADRDAGGTGERAALACRERLAASGVRSCIVLPPGAIPPGKKGVDWNDLWAEKGADAFPASLIRRCRALPGTAAAAPASVQAPL